MQKNIISPQSGKINTYNLGVAWNWEFDSEFIQIIGEECLARELSLFLIESQNLHDTSQRMENNSLSFDVYYDRASDTDDDFKQIADRVVENSTHVINPHPFAAHAMDKATMHLEFLTKGIHTPYTIILSPYKHQNTLDLNQLDFDRLGKPFIIKPANTTGGGNGVIVGAQQSIEIIEARQQHRDDKYLLQETISPSMLDGRRTWFRVIYTFGEIHLCWWDDITHVYTLLHAEEEQNYGLSALRSIIETIHDICRLDFFSSEIALTSEGKFVVVDYVNEVCDMRLQSNHIDGVPDSIVRRVAQLIVHEVEKHSSSMRKI
ncbi:MAG TPA: hypothetical protein VFF29_06820 [Bacteroidota bacterium]|nr:hypothetical protein [Bacteroidota bacterium]